MYKKYINRITGFLTIVMITLFSSGLSAQYISGPTTVTFGQYADYYLVGAPNEEVTSVSWIVYYGSIQNQSAGVISVLYSSQGTNYITVDYFNGFYWDSLYLVVEVVVEASVPTPTLSSVTQPTCTTATGSFTITNYNASYTYTASPSSGVSISGATVTAPVGSYTIIATSGGSSSSPSASVTVNTQPSGSTCGLSNENYIHTITPQTGITDISTLTAAQKLESVTYFDGLGRPIQTIGIKAGGNGEDIITHIGYDTFGRQSKEYLPYTTTSDGGFYRTGAEIATLSYYDATKYDVDFPGMSTSNANPILQINPYSQKEFEASPLNRVLKQAAPGNDWKLGNGHEIKLDYQTNTASEVKNFGVSLAFANNTYTPTLTQSAVNTGFYNANELYKTITFEENTAAAPTELNGSMVEFKNKQGQVVLKRTYGTVGTGTTNEKHDTYYVYDDYGNLTYVLPPKMEPSTAAIATINSQLGDLGYQYKYDHRNRLVEKKLPGKQWEFIVYDKLDRPILTQDANLLTSNKWLFTKYDAFGRVVYTGDYKNIIQTSRTAMQALVDTKTTLWETKQVTPSAINASTVYYTNVAFPNINDTNINLFTINYYDDYTFDLNGASATGSYHVPITNAKGLATGSKVRVLGTTNWITNVNYYDVKGRSICSYSKNDYLETTSKVNSKLDFVGKVQETTATQEKTGQAKITIVEKFTYDPQGRLLTQTQKINNQADELIVSNKYDELGQLKEKGVGGKTTQSRLQTVNYTYNIRGWLKGINDGDTSNSTITMGTGDLFGFQINYNNPSTGTALYNGNISQTFWKTANLDTSLKNYTYSYDALNRLKQATDNTGKLNETIFYDKNGNITNLTRLGEIVGGSIIPVITNASHFGVMDNLKYTYDSGNKLQIVSDSANDTYGFKDDYLSSSDDTTTDYTYDVNGNMKTDTNKGITAISYNHLNLPTSITLPGGTINYYYDATGVKQRKVASGTITNYAGGFQYEKNGTTEVLKFFPTAEGYVANNSGTFDYIYQYKDHLGNVRLSYGDKNNNGVIAVSTDLSLTELIEENNYYPFGLKHNGYNYMFVYGKGNATAQKYKYNGKELQDELGLNFYDYGARNYDPAIGRWMNIDPLAEEGRRFSPYNYGLNNPVFFIDPDGMLSQSFIDKIKNSASGTTWTNNDNGTFSSNTGETVNEGESSGDSGDQEDPKKLTPEQENEKWRKYNEERLLPLNEALINFAFIADGAAALSELLTIKSAFKLTSLSGLATKLLNKASKFTVASSKFDYFFGRVVTGSSHNIARSAQNLSDLTTLGIKTESDLIKVFNKAYNSPTIKVIESSHGVSVIKSASVGNQGQAIQVSFFYKGGNMNVTPSVSSIIPKL